MRPVLLALATALVLGGCAGDDGPDVLTVYAAASLQEVFEELAPDFEREHDVRVELNFGPSSGLAEQISAGAEADVFAAASTSTMDRVSESAEVFAINSLVVAVPPDNPAAVESLADLGGSTKVALCQARVPCGDAARQLLDRAGVTLTPVTEESHVKAVLTKVQLGEVDAGIVYVTDVLAAGGRVRGIEVPAADNVTTDYPIAALGDDPTAQAWVDLVLSGTGRRALEDHGFRTP